MNIIYKIFNRFPLRNLLVYLENIEYVCAFLSPMPIQFKNWQMLWTYFFPLVSQPHSRFPINDFLLAMCRRTGHVVSYSSIVYKLYILTELISFEIHDRPCTLRSAYPTVSTVTTQQAYANSRIYRVEKCLVTTDILVIPESTAL